MERDYDRLKHDVLELDEVSQMRLAEEIVESVSLRSGNLSLGLDEAEKRLEAYRTGKISARPAEDTLKEIVTLNAQVDSAFEKA